MTKLLLHVAVFIDSALHVKFLKWVNSSMTVFVETSCFYLIATFTR